MKVLSKSGFSKVSIPLLIVIIAALICRDQLEILFKAGNYNNADQMVETIMDKTATPGVAVLLSKLGETEFKYYGYADVQNQKMVTEESLFELGSTTKAFTALAIILLENEGYLSYSDYASDYISGFEPTHEGKKVKITINQLLAHTSGIPPSSIRLIPEGTTSDLLEKTIHNISDIGLDTYPGTAYNYATVNYDILAMIIEQVTGKSYQDYVTESILVPLGMTDSYFSTGQEKESDKLTKGYRAFFGKSLEYNAPRYYGNIAAGYLVTNLKDLVRWINAQMGLGDIPENLMNAIQQSHVVDIKEAGRENQDTYYSYGWGNVTKYRIINHSGSNPNYSSQVIIDLNKQQAVFVLANLNSSAPSLIAGNLYENLNGNHMSKFNYDDMYVLMDLIFSFLVILAVVHLCLLVNKLVRGSKPGMKDEQAQRGKLIGSSIRLFIRFMLLLFILIWPYLVSLDYYMVKVWMSSSVLIWMCLAAINCILSIVINIKRIKMIRHCLSSFRFKE